MIAVAGSGAPTFFAITGSSAHEPPPRMMRTKARPGRKQMILAMTAAIPNAATLVKRPATERK